MSDIYPMHGFGYAQGVAMCCRCRTWTRWRCGDCRRACCIPCQRAHHHTRGVA